MKIALINDTHFGVRSGSEIHSEHAKKFWKNIFFPYCQQHKIKTVIHLGDLVDSRKYILWTAAKSLREDLFEPIQKYGMTLHQIIGNHDSVYKNTLEVNAISEIAPGLKYIIPYTTATEVDFDGTKILILPWICDSNEEATLKLLDKTKCQIVMGHLELESFPMYKNTPLSEHGTLDKKLLNKFDAVYTGHFHTKSTQGNITYTGSQFEMTWNDYGDEKGFSVFDTETLEVTYVKNPYRLFMKYFYDDTDIDSIDKLLDHRFNQYEKCYVKIVTNKKVNHPEWFDVIMSEIEKVAIDVKIIDTYQGEDLIDQEETVNDAEPIDNILKKYCENANIQNKDKVYECIKELYQDALSLESSVL